MAIGAGDETQWVKLLAEQAWQGIKSWISSTELHISTTAHTQTHTHINNQTSKTLKENIH